jgi:Flp pilus assembly pilin Flp
LQGIVIKYRGGAYSPRGLLYQATEAPEYTAKGADMFARYIAVRRLVAVDCRGVSSVEYAVIAAAVVGTMLLSGRNFMTALSGIIGSFVAAL